MQQQPSPWKGSEHIPAAKSATWDILPSSSPSLSPCISEKTPGPAETKVCLPDGSQSIFLVTDQVIKTDCVIGVLTKNKQKTKMEPPHNTLGTLV